MFELNLFANIPPFCLPYFFYGLAFFFLGLAITINEINSSAWHLSAISIISG